MLLAFPTGAVLDDSAVNDTCTVQSVDRVNFNVELNKKLSEGWVISEAVSKFRKTLFGGVTSYKAELRRG